MSDLATMARPYCERLAKATCRFTLYDKVLRDTGTGDAIVIDGIAWRLWAFFGPLAEEFGVNVLSLAERALFVPPSGTLLESIMSAVCEAVERQSKTSGGEN